MPSAALVWIASYPKSGNTWMRLLLANYLVGGDRPVPINQVHRIVMFDAAAECYRSAGAPAFDPVRQPEVARRWRPPMLARVAGLADMTFVKTHAPRHPVDGAALIPPEVTRAVVYILRDPRDVAVSYARHFSTTPARAAAAIGRAETVILANARSVAQPIGAWSDHVSGWTDPAAVPAALVVRYEDLLAAPEETFAHVLGHLGLPVQPDRLRRAVEFASFDELRHQERRHGFREHEGLSQPFFHSGTSGEWRRHLPPEAIRLIERDHAAEMARFGYLPAATVPETAR